jgi:hypothetical protein
MIATTIDQSQRLLSAGVPSNTADMCYRLDFWKKDENGRLKGRLSVGNDTNDFPAWSLGALWDMIPKDFRDIVYEPKLNSEELIEALVKFIEETYVG